MNNVDRIARTRIAALDTSNYGEQFFARRDALRAELEARGLSAVATAELRLLEEECDSIDYDLEQQAKAETDAENAWLRAAEAPTNDDYAFEAWEAERCWMDPQAGYYREGR